MRKVLLGTTALVAAGLLVATTAQAQDEEEMMAEEEMMMAEPITAHVTGYYNTAFISYSGDDDAGERGHGIQQNMEIQVGGSTTLDNGITVSVSIDFRPDGAGEDDASVSLSGGFGTISYGNIPSAARGTPGAPWANALFNVNGAWFAVKGVDTGGGSGVGGIDKSVGVSYTSPNFNGFTLGVSYAPDANGGGLYVDRLSDEGEHSEQVGIGLSFSQAVLGGSFAAGVTHESHSTESLAGVPCDPEDMQCDPEVLRYGMSLSIDALTFGAGGLTADLAEGGERTVFNAGVSYALGGGTSVGIGIANQSDGAGTDSDIISLDLGYNLGPGIDLAASIQTGTDENAIGEGDAATDNDWTAVLVGTSINF